MFKTISALQSAFQKRQISAVDIVQYYLARINQWSAYNIYTDITAERALQKARRLDQKYRQGETLAPLAAVPFAVKNLFDIKGVVTRAGSRINRTNAPATTDAALIQKLEAADAICLGSLNMGEFAYDFTGENVHDGNCHNPWQFDAMTGGSSSGSGAALAADLAMLTLGSDTNGSIRVPASLCGVFGLKPTFGCLSRVGTYPFSHTLDHVGPMARDVADLALCFDQLQDQTVDVTAIPALRIARVDPDSYFATNKSIAEQAVDQVCQALSVHQTVMLEGAADIRAAAYLITQVEGSLVHRQHLQQQPQDFDPDTRYRFMAGSLLPASWYAKALQVRQQLSRRMREVFNTVDVIIAPATSCTAPLIGTKTLHLGGQAVPLRPNLGYFTQPISAAGWPVCVVPLWTCDQKPIGVQIIAAPGREDHCLQVAYALQQAQVTLNTQQWVNQAPMQRR